MLCPDWKEIAWAARLLTAWLAVAPINGSSAQDRPAGPSGQELQQYHDKKIARTDWQPTPQARAQSMLEQYEFVGTGEFVIADEMRAQLDAMKPRPVVVVFRIDRVYKGAKALPSIEVELNSDMLGMPGENGSGYAARRATWARLAEQGNRNKAALDDLEARLKAGKLDREEYDKRRQTLADAERKRIDEMARVSSRQVAVIDGKTFYDLGGALRAHDRYLLGVNRANDRVDVYVLEEVLNSNIYWGELREDVTAALDRLQR